MDGGSTLGVDPFTVYGVQGPGAVVGESASGTDGGYCDGDGVERFNGVDVDMREARGSVRHGKSLACERFGLVIEEMKYPRSDIGYPEAEKRRKKAL